MAPWGSYGGGLAIRSATPRTIPYADERAPHLCLDEDTLCAFLASLGIEAEARQHACAVARQGRVAVLCLRAAPAQMQTSFGPTPS